MYFKIARRKLCVVEVLPDLRVAFNSHFGERANRMSTVKQKISGCFARSKDAQDFCTIRSYLDTPHREAHNLFEELRVSLMGTHLCLPQSKQ